MKHGIIAIAGVIGLAGLALTSYLADWVGEAADVAKQQFGPSAALEKYEWFKNQAAAIKAAETNCAAFRETFESLKKKQLETKDVISMQLLEGKINDASNNVAAYEANTAALKAEYNAAASKFNWSAFQSNDVPKSY